jgi:lysophospholipase L1-like esterase
MWALVLTLLTTAGIVAGLLLAASLASQGSPEAPRSIAFLGDSYTGGSAMDSGESARWPALVSDELELKPLIFAEGGSGYVNPGQNGGNFADQLPLLVAEDPDVVVVAGGLNDLSRLSTDAGPVHGAASDLIFELRQELPSAEIVILSPFDHGAPRALLIDLGDHLRAAANAVGADYVDVLHVLDEEGRLVGVDGVHPTDAGHRAIASYLLEQRPFIHT